MVLTRFFCLGLDSNANCSDSGRRPHLPDPKRWEATYHDRTGRLHHRNFCAYHAVKFATRHDLIRCLNDDVD